MKITCPICKKEIKDKSNLYRPFCSKRCKLIDLDAWLSADYRITISGEVVKEEEEEL
ncbi:MAG: DNA gyrase inhibitor YacG [Nitrospirae bacterium]|nr:MAG: DNA gyrase inhibitor YacG [Nitrospirota bacterium]